MCPNRADLYARLSAHFHLPEDFGPAGVAVYDPYDNTRLTAVANGGEAETRAAVAAAEAAFKDWSRRPAKERSAILRRWMELMLVHQDQLADLIVLEQGKPKDQAKREVVGAVAYAGWFAEEAKRAYGDIIPSASRQSRILVDHKPIGTVAMLTPWNFPLTMVVRKSAGALAAGCTVVVKPSEHTPLSAYAVLHLAREAGFPVGVINVVTGSPATVGHVLSTDKRIAKLSFTGSTRVGKLLYAQAADTVKGLSLELGGNAPFIVFEDADLDKAVECAIASKFRNGGQTCVSANRILVQSSIYDAFTEAFAKQAAQQRTGDGFEPGIDYGPMIHPGAVTRIHQLIEDAVAQGGELLIDGTTCASGLLMPPTVVAGLDERAQVFSTEIFGPFAPIFRFDDEAEAIAKANNVSAGLAAYLHTKDLSRAWRVSEKLEAGVIGVNEGATSNEMAPFGGIKESGQGREGGYQGLHDYLETQYRLIGV